MRKKIHKDQYLKFVSHHLLHHKLGVTRTLLDICENIVTDPEDKKREEEHIHNALRQCGYPAWTLKKVKAGRQGAKKKRDKPRDNTETSEGMVVIHYIKGVSDSVQRVFQKHNIAVVMHPHQTLRNLLVNPKNKYDTSDV